MAERIRILIVDGSVDMRRLLARIMTPSSGIELAGMAVSGRGMMRKIEELKPDLVLLDIDRNAADLIEALGTLRKTDKRLPVLVISSAHLPNAGQELTAMAAGASGFLPVSAESLSDPRNADSVVQSLLPMMRALHATAATPGTQRPSTPSKPQPQKEEKPTGSVAETLLKSTEVTGDSPLRHQGPVPLADPPAQRRRIEVLAIGSSTGGPQALSTVLTRLPEDYPVPILVVQHMPPTFTSYLAQRLDGTTNLRVQEAKHGQCIEPGGVWIAPGGYHLTVERKGGSVYTLVGEGPKENSCRPSVDTLLRSVVSSYGAGTLAVILTGMGQDGLVGCRQVVEAGGRVIAQDKTTSVVWGMPGHVAMAGIAERVLPVGDIGSAISQMTLESRGLKAAG